ncbi:MAG: hypothetical protein M0011_12970 [Elusimicrobia bacterium]|nr:hypothetical protein [Elusimicrobiota bacterium]
MRKLLISALLLLPAAGYSQGTDAEGWPKMLEPVKRPDPQVIMGDLSTSLKLSSKQEERISGALKKKSAEFDKLMKEYDGNAEEEKKWRIKANEVRHEMAKVSSSIPDTIREYLDDEQRESFDALVEAKKKPAAAAAAAEDEQAPKPVKKRRLVRRKKAAPAAAAPTPAEEEGGVMVDSEAPKKRPVRKKPAPKAKSPAAEEVPAAEEPPASEEAPEEAAPGAYP